MVDRDGVRVNGNLTIPSGELSWRFTRSGGPGGQHANTADTRAEVTFDVTASAALGPRQRARLLERLGPTVTASASENRSQARNRALARDRLAAALAGALRRDPPARRRTRPSAGAVERRLRDKQRRSQRKAERRRPGVE